MPLVLINPEIELGDEIEIGTEGCLSFPEINGQIERAESTMARAQNLEGDKIEIEASGLLARAIQHEVDHLNGILFIDRMNSAAKAALSSRLKRLQKQTKRGKRIRPEDEQALVERDDLVATALCRRAGRYRHERLDTRGAAYNMCARHAASALIKPPLGNRQSAL